MFRYPSDGMTEIAYENRTVDSSPGMKFSNEYWPSASRLFVPRVPRIWTNVNSYRGSYRSIPGFLTSKRSVWQIGKHFQAGSSFGTRKMVSNLTKWAKCCTQQITNFVNDMEAVICQITALDIEWTRRNWQRSMFCLSTVHIHRHTI